MKDNLYLNQRIPTKQKNKQWRINMVDYYCNVANDWKDEWVRMHENYALKNNQLNREEYRKLCRGLGNEKEAEMFINAYNQTHNVIESLKGEEWNRPFSFGILNNSSRIVNRIERDKRREIEKNIDKIFEIEVKKQQEILRMEQSKLEQQGMDEEQLKQSIEKLNRRYEKLYSNLLSPKEIYDKYRNITVPEEITMNRLLRMMYLKQNIKWIKNSTFEDALIAGVEVVELYIPRENSLPRVKELNPLNVWSEKSDNERWIQNGDAAGYKERMTIGAILEEYGEELDDNDYKKLMTDYQRYGQVVGLDHKWSYNKDAPSRWKENLKDPTLPTRDTRNGMINVDGTNTGWIRRAIDYYSGLSTTEDPYTTDLLDVYTVYWKSQRRIGKMKYINEYGVEDVTFVDESYSLPTDARKEKVKISSFGKNKIVYFWEDDNDNTVSLEWIWIPEVWKGKRIGVDIYVDISPLQHAYQSLLNPYDVKLPIYGYIYNNRNAFSVSVMDRMKPWQKLYYVIMSKLLKLIVQDRGVWTFFNVLMVDDKLGLEKTMQIAENEALIPYNPLSNSKGAGGIALNNTMKVAEKIDATNSASIQHYISILQFIEQNMKKAVGMSDQRLAQTQSRSTATDNHRDTMHSINMTESLHSAHDLLWEEILQGLMEMTVSVLNESSGVLRGFLSDEERTLIDLDLITLEDNYNLLIANNSRAHRVLEQVKQLSHALLQNDKVSLHGLIDLLDTDNLNEFKGMALKFEEEFQQRIEQRDESQRQHEKELLEKQLQAKEDEQVQELDKVYLGKMMDHNREEMRARYQAMSFDMEKDYNKDGIADYLQIKQLDQKIANDSARIKLDEFKLAQEEREMEERIADKKRDREDKERDRQIKIDENNKERQLKKQTELLKNKIQRGK